MSRRSVQVSLASAALVSVALWMTPSLVHAASPAPDFSTRVIERLLISIRTASMGWTVVLQDAARGVFRLLALIQLAWTGHRLLTSGQASIPSAVGAYTRELLTLGFYLALLEQGPEWTLLLIQELEQLGRTAGDGAVAAGSAPQLVIDECIELCVSEFRELSLISLSVGPLAIAGGLFLLVLVFAVMAGLMFLAQTQAFIVLGAGSVLLGCGGTVWTRSFVQGYLRHAFGAGLKLMFFHLVHSVFVAHMRTWLETARAEEAIGFETLGTMLVSGVVIVVMLFKLPTYVEAMVTGSQQHGESVLGNTMLGLGLAAGGKAVAAGARGTSAAAKAVAGQAAALGNALGNRLRPPAAIGAGGGSAPSGSGGRGPEPGPLGGAPSPAPSPAGGPHGGGGGGAAVAEAGQSEGVPATLGSARSMSSSPQGRTGRNSGSRVGAAHVGSARSRAQASGPGAGPTHPVNTSAATADSPRSNEAQQGRGELASSSGIDAPGSVEAASHESGHGAQGGGATGMHASSSSSSAAMSARPAMSGALSSGSAASRGSAAPARGATRPQGSNAGGASGSSSAMGLFSSTSPPSPVAAVIKKIAPAAMALASAARGPSRTAQALSGVGESEEGEDRDA